jgi:penicillin-binding protein 1C
MKTFLQRFQAAVKPASRRIALLFLLIAATWFWLCLPEPLFKTPTSFVIEDQEGGLLGAAIAADGQWRFPYNPDVPEKFSKCIITFEDKRFERHPGFDPIAFSRAARQNLKAGRVISGGSTISMQVIRMATRNKRNISQKIVEIIRALRLELRYSKAEILGFYASNAPFGSNVVGLDAASWRYYGRDPHQLSWGETAALAVLPNAPSMVHPGKNRDVLLKKRNSLINQLYQQKIIDSTTAALAKLEPVPDKPMPLPQNAPHLLDHFKREYKRKPEGSTRITTTIADKLQQDVTAIVERHHQVLKANDINNIAAMVLDVESGNALAYVGNIFHPEEAELESHVDIIQAARSPGSTLKPLLFAALLNDGAILPNTLIPDIPTQIAGYQPENFDLGYDGAIQASKALSRSLNIPAVKMLQQYKYERFHAFLRKSGMTTLKKPADFYGLSLILGGGESSLWELGGIYAGMARVLNHYESYKGKYDPDDFHGPNYQFIKKTGAKNLEPNGLIDAASIYHTFQAMEEVMRPGEELLWQQFTSSQRVAWKTGTSFGFRDGWAIGLDPRYVVAVWVGNADGEGRPGLTGINTAAPVLFEIFRLLPSTEKWFDMPVGAMVKIPVCPESGYRAGQYCLDAEDTWVPRSGLKSGVCPYHQLIHLSADKQFQVTADCEDPSKIIHQPWFVLPPAMEYYYKTRNYQYKILPPFRAGCMQNQQTRQLEIIYPKSGAKIYIPIEADGSRGKMICNAAHRLSDAKLFWHLDNEYLGETHEFHQISINPSPGKHILTLVDEEGNRSSSSFEILEK